MMHCAEIVHTLLCQRLLEEVKWHSVLADCVSCSLPVLQLLHDESTVLCPSTANVCPLYECKAFSCHLVSFGWKGCWNVLAFGLVKMCSTHWSNSTSPPIHNCRVQAHQFPTHCSTSSSDKTTCDSAIEYHTTVSFLQQGTKVSYAVLILAFPTCESMFLCPWWWSFSVSHDPKSTLLSISLCTAWVFCLEIFSCLLLCLPLQNFCYCSISNPQWSIWLWNKAA